MSTRKPRSKLILDANVVIYLHERGLWQAVLGRCDVYLSGTVIDHEALFYEAGGFRNDIDLSSALAAGKVRRFDVLASEVKAFRSQFDPAYRGELDPGEEESLTYMFRGGTEVGGQQFRIVSGDAIVYRILGNLNLGHAGVSLEELLGELGLGRKDLAWQYTRAFRHKYTSEGEQHAIRGLGRKSKET